jgi:hypothetical protein
MTDEPKELPKIQFPEPGTPPPRPWLIGPLMPFLRRGEIAHIRANERGEIVEVRPESLWDALRLISAEPEGTA